ncbi:hypothetical protein DL764_004907 [Monosporascus ibericus]|uniref:SMP-30/Gluconolactonase/LRE-like region domain-containing protein n=1 Tax=Monosporascus ibericus TaxID=155417 RepID=A0A4Q4TB07_9PEZI|nr:hypothetical protein DL764_004907 [Monosporascus ibericus]
MPSFRCSLAALLAGVLAEAYANESGCAAGTPSRETIPAQAQVIDQKAFNVLPYVPPLTESNATTFFVPPGLDAASLKDRPFHIYDDEFYDVIGSNPTLTLIARTESDPLFHEAVVWYPPTDEVFFVQNAGARAAGTGLNKSSIILKIDLSEAAAVSDRRNATGAVSVHRVDSNPLVVNPNGATNYKGQLLFAAEGQGADVTSELIIMNPREPYNTTGKRSNCPRGKGYLQDFRPPPGMRNQVYRLNDKTGAVTAVADGFHLPNGITFSPDGKHAYVADTGASQGFWGFNQSYPASIYRFDVQDDGTWENRKLFAYAHSRVPDGIHCDSNGNVYSGCGDGVHVWNPSGKLIGKIYLGEVSANFNFAGDGRMVICAETNLYYATLAASGGGYIGDF